MKIADLKQPYRRMVEYLAEKNENPIKNVEDFSWYETGVDFWKNVYHLEYPPITEEIKKHFPPNFDFSEEEVKNKPVMQMLDIETQKYIYTQLAEEGKFDQLPDICEFSESVELEVWDDDDIFKKIRRITGKYKGYYMDINRIGWNFAKLPTKKIDFSEFKTGDVVEVETNDNSLFLGYFSEEKELNIDISYAKDDRVGLYPILKENIKTITKIK